MFPGIERRRFDSIYGNNQQQAEFGPPDFNGGMNIHSILDRILPLLQQKQQPLPGNEQGQSQLQAIAEATRRRPIEEQQRQEQLKPKVMPGHITNYNGMSAYENETINFKKRELEQKERLANRGLDVKEGDNTTDASIAREKLAQGKDLGQQRIDVSKGRADVYKFKAEHPNVQIIRTKGGNVHYYDPVDKIMRDSGVSSGELSDEDEIELRSDKKIAEQTSGSNNRLGEIAARAAEQRTNMFARPSSASNDRTAMNSKARELLSKNPSLEKYLIQDEKGDYINKALEGSNEAKLINDTLYRPNTFGRDINLPSEGIKVTTPKKKEEEQAPIAPKGWKYVKKPGGGWTAVEDKGGK